MINKRPSVVIVAHPHIGFEGVRALIDTKPHLQFLAYLCDQSSLKQLLPKLLPDILIVCYAFLNQQSGTTLKEIRELSSNTKVLVISSKPRPFDSITSLYQAGARGFLCSTTATSASLFDAIDVITQARNFYQDGYLEELTARAIGVNDTQLTAGQCLGVREIQVLNLIADGLSAKEIARHLAISIHTVQVHRRNIMNKLDIHKSTELTRYAIERNLATV